MQPLIVSWSLSGPFPFILKVLVLPVLCFDAPPTFTCLVTRLSFVFLVPPSAAGLSSFLVLLTSLVVLRVSVEFPLFVLHVLLLDRLNVFWTTFLDSYGGGGL